MNTPGRLRPVPRLQVLAGACVLLAALAGVAGLAGTLRHPPTVTPVPEPPDADDPRDDVACPPPATPHRPLPVSSNDLYDCPHTYDGHTVMFQGEVVGAVLTRRDSAWVQLNDDAYAGDLGPLPAHREFRGGNSGVGVLLPSGLADDIDWVGGPNARGDVLTITGTYHLSDPASGEVAIIHATNSQVTRRGQPITHQALRDRQIAGSVLALAALALLGAGRLATRRR